MKYWILSGAMAIVLWIMLLAACAPAAAPAPIPAPAPQAAPAAPAQSVEEAAWAKVVEAAKKEGRVTIYGYTFVGDAGTALTRAFRAKYGIEIDIITGRGAAFLERLKTEQRAGRISGDIFEGASNHAANVKREGLLVGHRQQVPALQEKAVWLFAPWLFDPEGVFLNYNWYITPTVVNTKLVRPEDYPRSWYDLLDPKWKGKIIYYDPRLSVAGYSMLYQLQENKRVEPDFVERFARQELVLVSGIGEAAEKLARGEYPLAAYISPSQAVRYVQEGAPIRAIPMKEGVRVTGLVVGAIKDSPHPQAAKLFLDWILSPEGQKVVAEATGLNAIRKGVPDVVPEPLRVEFANPMFETPETVEAVAKLLRERAWVGLFVK